MIEADGHLALGELELKFATDLLDWLCRKRVIGSITRRAALMAIMPPPTAARLADGRSRPATERIHIAEQNQGGRKPATGGPRR